MSGVVTHDLTKKFGSKTVLNAAGFSAPAGEVTLLAGLNGAGKTTWVRAALGMTQADSGSVEFDGAGIHRVRPDVAVVFDEPPVYPAMSGRNNLSVLSGGVRTGAAERDSILEMLALTPEFLAMRGKEYSLGQRRRLSVAAALLRKPKYLFLDEPTIGLDPVAWGMVRDSVRDLAEAGCAIVLTGQDFGELSSVVGRVVVLHSGRALFDGSVEELTAMRPARVWVETSQPDPALLGGWLPASDRPGVLERACASLDEAAEIMDRVRRSQLPITGLGVRRDSLEEAFLSVVGSAS